MWSEGNCYPSSVRNRYLADKTKLIARLVLRQICPKACKALHKHSFSRCKKRFVDNVLNNKTIILLNLAEYWPRRLLKYQAIFRAIV